MSDKLNENSKQHPLASNNDGDDTTGGIPEGFTAVVSGDFPPEWDFTDKPELLGVVLEKKMLRLKNEQGPYDAPLLIVNKRGESYSVWISTMLMNLYNSVSVLDEVYIRFTGTKPNKDSDKEPMKLFESGFMRSSDNADKPT